MKTTVVQQVLEFSPKILIMSSQHMWSLSSCKQQMPAGKTLALFVTEDCRWAPMLQLTSILCSPTQL
jgi:hypothetical protein